LFVTIAMIAAAVLFARNHRIGIDLRKQPQGHELLLP
jgi:hypothetical protein